MRTRPRRRAARPGTPRRSHLVAAGLALLLCAGLPSADAAMAVDAPAPEGPSASAPGVPAGPLGGPLLDTRGLALRADATLPPLPAVTGAAWLVADLDSGAVLAAQDPHGQYAPASTLKTLTAVALIPRLDPERTVVPAFEDVDAGGSKVGLVSEVAYPVRELFTALLAVSGNDAAGALATAVGGMPAAAGLLNAEAARLQARDTVAVNTSGLDAEGQVSSPYDLALIARAGMAMPAFRDYVAVRTSSVSAPAGARIEITNHNRLLARYEGALGIKNGYTSRARASFVGAATRGDRSLLVTVMRAEPAVWQEAAALLDWGFAASAAGVRPVGRLVEPLPPAAPAVRTERTAEQAAPAAQSGPGATAASGRSEAQPAGTWSSLRWPLLALLLLVLAVLRRRQVVVARRRRARRTAARGPDHWSARTPAPDVLPQPPAVGPASRRAG